MNLPFKIASQYLFTDKFFSREGFITNAILSILALFLLTIDVRYGVPILIFQLLPFQFVKNAKLSLLIKGIITQ